MLDFKWINIPKSENQSGVVSGCATIITDPETDLWQRTYHGFRKANAQILAMPVKSMNFKFSLKAGFDYKSLYDQCGLIIYIDEENWIKASVEYEGPQSQKLGSVVTNLGFSDWATCDISSSIDKMWYRITRFKNDFILESSENGTAFHQMRMFHMQKADSALYVGMYACSPSKDGSFRADFSEIKFEDA